MPLKEYGVLKGRPVARRLAVTSNAHYQVHLVDDDTDYRIAINVKSKLSPSELEYLIDENFNHPITASLVNLPLGFKPLQSQPGGLALDFIRGNLLDRTKMIPLPFNIPGPDNDLNDKIDHYIQRAMSDEEALIYAFGERWGPEPRTKDKIFGFLPGNGIHDIHMNQGNAKKFEQDDGVWQDGALLIHFPTDNRWIGIFLKFQSQCWHTDDTTGHCIVAKPAPGHPTETPIKGEVDLVVRIIAALVNPEGADLGIETVTLLNTSPTSIDLTGWAIADRLKNKHSLSGTLASGSMLVVQLPQTVQLGNKGGIITLLDSRGIKIDGVSYTEKQAAREGWTLVF
ncbi:MULTISPECIES: DUF2278 family protein [Trichocoleus]|uniref:DUF2278 family protein n=1 Tax=Trichocoleus desertorum GB2-A4 TaxID=2933944 RepID=A0ABV0JHE4_9CYAN|nr:DUF2278 family protein [Trichocoleus sp. FACHB-46]MBD1864810.1 DUF2278 family protein [Trichocoleus sp. FACHB-46]